MRFILSFFFILFLVPQAYAQNMEPFMGLVFPENTTEESRAIIQKCWDIKLEDKTNEDKYVIHQSMAETRICLRQEIKQAWYGFVDFEQENIENSLQAVQAGVRDLALDAFVGYKGCPKTDCGFVFTHAVEYEKVRVFQRILANLYWQKEAYKDQ